MIVGIILILLSIACYLLSIFLMKHFIDKKTPGLLDVDAALPPPKRNQEYLWEKTSGAGIVPKWVSLIGLLAIPIFIFGVLILIISLIK